mmetsp:Transcript_22835/g.25415  ORF Transcript_22835/g.25415 Transcript_22835/m.25415 type:complete len:213 (-) Transcript_22835:84-722(-)
MTLPNLAGYKVAPSTASDNNRNAREQPKVVNNQPHPQNMRQGTPVWGMSAPDYAMGYQDIQLRKDWIRNHPLFTPVVRILKQCKTEGMLGFIQPAQYDNEADFHLDSFFADRGLTLELDENDPNINRKKLVRRLRQLNAGYLEELDKLGRIQNEFQSRMMILLQEQASFRPVTQQELHVKVKSIAARFDFVRQVLRQNVCRSIDLFTQDMQL